MPNRERHPGATKEHIVDVAAGLMPLRAVDATSVDQVLAESGSVRRSPIHQPQLRWGRTHRLWMGRVFSVPAVVVFALPAVGVAAELVPVTFRARQAMPASSRSPACETRDVIAYKFLDAEQRGPCTGVPWELGRWVEATNIGMCWMGVHACKSSSLAHWLGSSLWEVELDGGVIESPHKMVAVRGRILRRVDGYDQAVWKLADDAAWRCRDRALDALRARGDQREIPGQRPPGKWLGQPDATIDRVLAATTLDDLVALRDNADDSTFVGKAIALTGDAAERAQGTAPAGAPFVAAYSAGHAAAGDGGSQAEFDRGYAQERVVQSAWLSHQLGLDPVI